MRKVIAVCAMFAVAGSLALRVIAADRAAAKADDDKPKFTIKEVMKNAHAGKDALVKKAIAGDTSADENKELLVMYQALAQNEAPKGDADSWKAKTEALVVAAQAVVDGGDGAGAKLEKAANCGACHGAHKPKKN